MQAQPDTAREHRALHGRMRDSAPPSGHHEVCSCQSIDMNTRKLILRI